MAPCWLRSPNERQARQFRTHHRLDPHQYDGYAISLVFYDLYGGTADLDKDRAIRRRIEALVQPLAAGSFNAPLAERALSGIRNVLGVSEASYAIYASDQSDQIVLVISATLASEAKPAQRGAIKTGHIADLPVLLENEHALLRMQLNTGTGFYLDDNP